MGMSSLCWERELLRRAEPVDDFVRLELRVLRDQRPRGVEEFVEARAGIAREPEREANEARVQTNEQACESDACWPSLFVSATFTTPEPSACGETHVRLRPLLATTTLVAGRAPMRTFA